MSRIQNIITTILIGGTTALGTTPYFLARQVKRNLTQAGQTIAVGVMDAGVKFTGRVIDESVKRAIPPIADEIALNLFIPGCDKESIELRGKIRTEIGLKLASK